jgi:hypothetical protein
MTESQAKIKAKFTQVQIGNFSIDGYLLPDGSFGMSQTQVFSWVDSSVLPSQAAKRYIEITRSKVAQTLTPNGFVVHRKIVVRGCNERVNVVPINDVAQFLVVALAMGYTECAGILALLSSLSLQQLFCDAFNIKFEKAERQEWITNRQRTIDTFKSCLTDALKESGFTEPWQYGTFIHQLQDGLGIKDGTRDELSIKDLSRLTCAQEYIGMAITEFNCEPYRALRSCLEKFGQN